MRLPNRNMKGYNTVIRYLSRMQQDVNRNIAEESRFLPDADFAKMKELAAPVINKGCNTGDGWLVAAEVADLAEKGYENILLGISGGNKGWI